MEKEIQTLQQAKLAAQASVLSRRRLQKSRQTSIDLQREASSRQQQAQAEIQRLNADLLDELPAEGAADHRSRCATRGGCWVIFAQQDEPGGLAVIACNPGLDLSAEVVKRLDATK